MAAPAAEAAIDEAAALAPTPANRDRIEAAWRAVCPDNFLAFVEGLTIPSATGPRCFANCIAEFQKLAFGDIAPALAAVRDGRPIPPPHNRFWWERTKKAGKDSDLAACVLWLAAFPRRPFLGQIGAADREQAGIVRDRVSGLLTYNRWLNELVELHQYQIRSRRRAPDGSPLARWDILAADVSGSHGDIPDMLILNELSHVRKWGFVRNLMANAAGVAQGIVVVATNAGLIGGEAEQLRQAALRNENWAVRVVQRPARWISQDHVREQRPLLGEAEYLRLWWGKWISGTGDAVPEDQIDRCFTLPGPAAGPEPGWQYLMGLDLGVSHDHAGVAVLGIRPDLQRVRVARVRGWEPQRETGEVDLIAVEREVVSLYRQFNAQWLGYDPAAGGSFMAQRLRRQGVAASEVAFTAANLTAMAEAFVQVVGDGVLEAYPDPEGRLRRDFGKFQIERRPPSGCRLRAVSDSAGHADVGTALVLILPRARALLGLPGAFGPGAEEQIAAAPAPAPEPTAEERGEMPAALAEIYELHDRVAAGARRAGVRRDL